MLTFFSFCDSILIYKRNKTRWFQKRSQRFASKKSSVSRKNVSSYDIENKNRKIYGDRAKRNIDSKATKRGNFQSSFVVYILVK